MQDFVVIVCSCLFDMGEF